MKSIEQITKEYCGCEPPEPIPELRDEKFAVRKMMELSKKHRFEREDLFEVCAYAGIGVVACWRIDYKFCRNGGISISKLYEDGMLLASVSEEGAMIRTWVEERLPKVLADVDACDTIEDGARSWINCCAAAYRYGMALEQQILDMKAV